MNKTSNTKMVKCAGSLDCSNLMSVPKWASNTQYCEQHTIGAAPEEVVEMAEAVPEPTPVSKLQHSQQVLSALGFTITSRGWRKQYADGDAIVVIEPFFDQGTSLDQDHALASFVVYRQEIVAVADSQLSQRMPAVTHQDVQSLLTELQVKMPGVALDQTHIDTMLCDKCGERVGEWIMIGKQTLCIESCAPAKRRHAVAK